ncbi:hypothetical protein GCM10022393_07170 [Aquimarina addita]|uniref:Collagen-like protein n=1 Tax=Aquimarina addita TaxID=870485 RepID=A0ABP7XB96_9FLAO
MKTTLRFLTYFMMAFAIVVTSTSCEGEDGMDGADGVQGEQGIPGEQGEPGPTRSSIYTESGSLNNSSYDVTSTATPVGPVLNFTKTYDDSYIEVFLNSNIASGTFAGGASGISFEIRLDGNLGSLLNNGAIGISNAEEFISVFDVFENVDIGDHTVQIYARTNTGTSSGIVLDPGGWNGKIIVKETF